MKMKLPYRRVIAVYFGAEFHQRSIARQRLRTHKDDCCARDRHRMAETLRRSQT
jgi:hypothetical protein